MTTQDMKGKISINKQRFERRLPLEKFIPAAFLIFLLCLIILSLITYNNIEEYKNDVSWINHTQNVIKINDRIRLLTAERIIVARNYVTTGDSVFLHSYEALHSDLKNEIVEIKENTKDNPSQKINIAVLDSLINVHSVYIDSLFQNRKSAGPQVFVNVSFRLQDQTNQLSIKSQDIENEEKRLLEERSLKAARSNSDIQLIIVITSLFGFIVIGMSLFISNNLIRNKNKAEKLLVKSYEELEEKVIERTNELKTSNEKLLDEILSREKTEQTLRESEKRFKEMADSATVLIWMSGRDKLCYYFNKTWLDFTGRTLEQELGNGWAEGVHPDDFDRCLDIYITHFDKHEPFEMEYRLRDAKGEYRWIIDRGVPRFEGNEFLGYIGSCLDIHERKINEKYLNIQSAVSKTLAEAETYEKALKTVLERVCTEVNWDFGIMWMVDKNKMLLKVEAMWSNIVPAVKQYSDMFDRFHNFSLGEGLPGIVWEENRAVWVSELKDDANFPRKKAASEMGWHSAIGVPIVNDGEVTAVMEFFNKQILSPKEDLLRVLESVGRQIGNFFERKKAEEDVQKAYASLEEKVKDRTVELANTLSKLLKEIEQKEQAEKKLKLYSYAICDLKECVYITDLNNNTLFVNAAFEEVYGYFEKELLGKKIPVLNEFHTPLDVIKDIEKRSQKGSWKGEFLTKRKDGSEFYVGLSTTIIRNDMGAVEAIIGICQDITDERHVKEIINKRNDLLNLINDIILLTNKTFDLNEVIAHSINRICQYTNWDIGHCFLKEGSHLVSSKIWNAGLESKYFPFREISEKMDLKDGKGLPGKAFQSGDANWVRLKDVLDKKLYERADSFQEMNLKTGIWIPILKNEEVIGVLEFFKSEETLLDKEILETIKNIAIEIGSVADRADILKKITRSEKQFKAVSDTANDAIITADDTGMIWYVNKSVEMMFGYGVEEILGNDLKILMPERYKSKHDKAFNTVIKTGKSHLLGKTLELSGRRKNGEEFPIELSLSQWDNNGDTFFTGMVKDITIRKSIEKELLQKQHMLLQAQQIAKLGSWEWDVKTNKIFWSDETYAIYEVDRETFDLNFENYISRMHPDDRELARRTVENSVKNKQPFNYFHRIVTPSGKIKILNAQGEAVFNEDGDVVKMYGTGLDVTEIKKAEERIRESERQLQEAQHIAKIGSWEYLVKEKSTLWSDELYRIWGYEPGEIHPHFDSIKHLIHPEDQNIIESITKSVKQHKPTDLNFRVVTPEGRLKYLHIEVLTEYDENDKPQRVYGSIQDITEMKIVEDELRKTNDMLMQAQKQSLHNEKLAALGRFSSGIAHEIRNPLANISALAQIVSKVNLDEKSKKHLKYILINADLANKIIKDLLNFASPEDLTFEYEDLKEILNNIVGSVGARGIEAKIKIETFISPDLPQVYVDRVRLENAFMNFASNALDAMTEGGKLTIIAGPDNLNKEIIIQFIDTGSGISAENLDKILEPFFTTKENGTGLGMGLAYQTIKAHMGEFNITSDLGKGTQIEIKLPIRKK